MITAPTQPPELLTYAAQLFYNGGRSTDEGIVIIPAFLDALRVLAQDIRILRAPEISVY